MGGKTRIRWHRIMDLNHDRLIQGQACCRYTNPEYSPVIPAGFEPA